MYRGLSVKTDMVLEDRERICLCVYVCVCGLQNPEDPQIEPRG